MELRSPAIPPHGRIPAAYTCEGKNLSPPFEWSGVPTGTATLILTCDDPDAPRRTFRHWAAYNIPASATGLAEGEAPPATAVNDFGKPGYGGPCPPRGDPPHRYVFRLAALSGRIDAPAGARCGEVRRLARQLELATAELSGTFGR
jgi:Raf kinase inhibitor-like YbhB/YbcL family protein